MSEPMSADLRIERALLEYEQKNRGTPQIYTVREIWERSTRRTSTVPEDYKAYCHSKFSGTRLLEEYRQDLLDAGKPGRSVLLALATRSPGFVWSVWSQGSEIPLELAIVPWVFTGQVLDLCESMEWRVITR